MPGTPSLLPLLGLAEELSASETPVGDPVTDEQVRRLLDHVVDAIVDVTLGRAELSRPHPWEEGGPGVPAPSAADITADIATHTATDVAACSALAARCHRAASILADVEDQRLAESVGACLTVIANGLQRLAQDVRDNRVPQTQTRQQLRRTLRRAATLLGATAP